MLIYSTKPGFNTVSIYSNSCFGIPLNCQAAHISNIIGRFYVSNCSNKPHFSNTNSFKAVETIKKTKGGAGAQRDFYFEVNGHNRILHLELLSS